MTTPIDIDAILTQRDELKRRDPEAILLIRIEDHRGDSYRAFGDDAHQIEKILDRHIAGVEYHFHGTVGDWSGIPAGMLEPAIARLVAAGKRGLACERVPPAEAARIREAEKAGRQAVERIVTPGEIAATRSPDPGWLSDLIAIRDELRSDHQTGDPTDASDLASRLDDAIDPARNVVAQVRGRLARLDEAEECLANLTNLIHAGFPREDITVQRVLREAKELLGASP